MEMLSASAMASGASKSEGSSESGEVPVNGSEAWLDNKVSLAVSTRGPCSAASALLMLARVVDVLRNKLLEFLVFDSNTP